MARSDNPPPTQLDRDLVELKLLEIAQGYREVLDEAARKGSSMLEVLATLAYSFPNHIRNQTKINGFRI